MNETRKLHPLAILLYFLKLLKDSVWLVISGVIFIGTSDINALLPNRFNMPNVLFVAIFLVLILLIFLTISWFRWHRFRYIIHQDAVQITKGVLVRHDRMIKTKNIHSMNINQHIFHQVFHLAHLKIETAGSDIHVDGDIVAMDFDLARQIKYQFTNNLPLNGEAELPVNEVKSLDSTQTWHSSFYRLLAAGVTTGRIGTLLAIAFVLPSEISSFLPEKVYQTSESWILKQSFVVWMILIALYVSVMISVGVMSFLLKHGRFTLQREGDYLIIKHGLIEKKEMQLHINRIQAITFTQNPFRMPFGWYGCYVDFAGGEFDEKAEGRILLYPLLKKKEINVFLKKTLPEYHQSHLFSTRTPIRGYVYRFILLSVLVVSTVAIVSFFSRSWWNLLILFVALLLGGLIYLFEYRVKGYAVVNDMLKIDYFHRLSRCQTYVKRNRMLDLNRIETPASKRLQLCHMKFSVMNNFIGQTFKYSWLEHSQMDMITKWFSKKPNIEPTHVPVDEKSH